MKSSLSALLLAAIAATLASTSAMPAGDAAGISPPAYPVDCTKWKDKARCETLMRGIEACKSKTDDEWRDCMQQSALATKFTPPKPRDCSKARNKERCEAHSSALEACKNKTTRTEHRKCMTEQLSGPGKS
jgi:hypothetical protein